jgi:hypothetical protein
LSHFPPRFSKGEQRSRKREGDRRARRQPLAHSPFSRAKATSFPDARRHYLDPQAILRRFLRKSGLGVPTQDAKFDRGLDVEEVNAVGFEPVEQPGCFLCCDSDLHLNRLIGKLKKMRRMDAAAASEALASGMERSAAKSQFTDHLHKPIADLPASMTATLMRKERDLVAVRHGALLTSFSAIAQSLAQRKSSSAIR